MLKLKLMRQENRWFSGEAVQLFIVWYQMTHSEPASQQALFIACYSDVCWGEQTLRATFRRTSKKNSFCSVSEKESSCESNGGLSAGARVGCASGGDGRRRIYCLNKLCSLGHSALRVNFHSRAGVTAGATWSPASRLTVNFDTTLPKAPQTEQSVAALYSEGRSLSSSIPLKSQSKNTIGIQNRKTH